MVARVLKGERLEKELARSGAMTQYEEEYEAYAYVCDIDEAGRGPLAGSVATGAMILPKGCRILYLNDSRKPSEKRRKELSEGVKGKAAAWSMGIASPARIDEVDVPQTIYRVTRNAAGRLDVTLDVLLNDAVIIPGLPMKQVPIIGGDAESLPVAAASVLAKIIRDHMMAEYGEMFPGYGFAKHRGYGTAAHIQTIRELGPCPIHRRSLVRDLVEQEDE